MQLHRKIGWGSAAAIVVANMVGTGVFTTLGLQLKYLQNTWTILSVWIIGGAIALFGAFSYAELGARLPRSGGEYHFLSRIYHPFVGYLSGWVSLTVGFSASIALAAMAMAIYIEPLTNIPRQWIALFTICGIAMAHSFSIRQSSVFQNSFTILKLLLLIFLIWMGLERAPHAHELDWSDTWKSEIAQPSYAILLVYVMYAFSGWNAAAYIVEEIKSPARNLPRALIGGTILVSVLFIALQLSFLMQAPTSALQGKLDIALVVTERMFGEQAGRIVSLLIALLLIASISAMTWVGPRVVRAMANDFQLWRFFGKDNQRGIPVRAIWLQTAISSFMVLTSSFEKILLYSGFVLQFFTTLTVVGVIVLRFREGPPQGYRSPAFPLFQVLFLVFSVGMLIVLVQEEPKNSLWGFVNVALGAGSYWWNRRHERNSGILEKNRS